MLFIFSSSGGVDADGNDWMENHDDCCPAGFTCEYDSQYYSQCKESTSTKKTITKKRTFNFLKAKAKQAFKGTKGRIHAKDDVTCKTDSDCTDGTDPHCVVESEFYSACVDCDPSSFSTQCQFMSASFLNASEKTCSQTCEGRCPGGSDSECPSDESCIYADGADACVDCSSQSAFDEKCQYMSDDWIISAQDKCGLDCTTRCPTHSDSDCADGLICVVQSDGYFDQCIDCTKDSFEEECKFWSDDIRSAAEEACGLTCEM